MLTKPSVRTLLRSRGTLLLDGALATELEARGLNLNHPLWSGKVLKDDPDSIQQVHLDYYTAGADVAITASYQASIQGLKDHLDMTDGEAVELVKRSVRLAQRARCQAYQSGKVEEHRKLLVAGSVGPYGAYLADGSEYRGDYHLSAQDLQAFHRPRIKALVDAGVDLLAIETMPSFAEIGALLDLLRGEFPEAVAWVSCTVKDAEHLSDGTDMKEVLELVVKHAQQVVAFGVNCVPMAIVTPVLLHLQSIFDVRKPAESSEPSSSNGSVEQDIVILCYPNSGEIWNAETKRWSGNAPANDQQLGLRVQYWLDAGARMIGGCCRTGPRDIERMCKAVQEAPTD